MNLFVDDIRPSPAGWRLARTVEEALAMLEAEVFEEVSLDYVIGYDDRTNFLPVARFIATLPEERRPKTVYIHTSSEAGAQALWNALEGAVRLVRRLGGMAG